MDKKTTKVIRKQVIINIQNYNQHPLKESNTCAPKNINTCGSSY